MKAIVSAMAVAALGSAVQAPAQDARQTPGGPQPMVRMMRPPAPAMSGDRADLAMQLVDGLPTILATVNGKGPYRFGLDTGAAGYLRLTAEAAQKLGLEPVGEALSGDPSGRNPVRVPIYRVDSLAFGGLVFTGVSTSARTLSRPGVDGIIGVGFFDNLLLTIDYGRGRVVAEKGALSAVDGRDIVDLSLDHGVLPTVPLKIGETVHQVHLDTGNTRYPLFMPSDTVASLPTTGQPHDIGTAHTVSQEIKLQALDLAAPVSVGATRLPVAAVGFPAPTPSGNIGSLALKTMMVTLDVANRRVRIVPSGH
jgi:hypothetical protein